MPSLPKKLIDSAADLGRKAVGAGAELAGRLRREESDTTVPPPGTSPSPDAVGAPKPGAPAAPKSATTRRKPKAKAAAKVKPSGRGATAKAGPRGAKREPAQAANGAAATPTEGVV